MKKDFVMPIVVLTLICLVMTAALAFTNSVTEPKITADKAARAEAARTEIIPEAEGFELIEIDGLPEGVTEAYKSTNDVGYVFMVTASGGYGGDIKLICGVSAEGKIIASKTLEHSETKGIGTLVVDSDDFSGQFIGKDSTLEGVSAKTGATYSSAAYTGGIKAALEAYDIVKEAGQ